MTILKLCAQSWECKHTHYTPHPRPLKLESAYRLKTRLSDRFRRKCCRADGVGVLGPSVVSFQ